MRLPVAKARHLPHSREIMATRPKRRSLQHRIARYPRWLRIGTGSALVLGGIFGFLPILGFWMAPLGLLVLSRDIHRVRRIRRRLQVRWMRRRRRHR